MAKKTSPQLIRPGAERIHIVISKELAKKLRDIAAKDGRQLSVTIERTIWAGLGNAA